MSDAKINPNEVKLTREQIEALAQDKCPGCGGKLQHSEFFDETVMCADRNNPSGKPALCSMYFRSPSHVRRALIAQPIEQ